MPASQRRAADGFGRLLRAEWTKFRTVRGWVIGIVVAALVTVGLGAADAPSGSVTCGQGTGLRPAARRHWARAARR